MEELFLAVLGVIFEFLLEAIFDYLIVGFADILLRLMGEVFEEARIQNPVRVSIGYALFGVVLGFISVGLVPHHILPPARIHGLSLMLSPIITGLMMWATGATLRRNGKKAIQLESFSYGFCFAFGMAAIRLLLTK